MGNVRRTGRSLMPLVVTVRLTLSVKLHETRLRVQMSVPND